LDQKGHDRDGGTAEIALPKEVDFTVN
jgi:hypothetical protein